MAESTTKPESDEERPDKSRDGAALSPKLAAEGLPIGKNIAAVAKHYKHAAGKSDTYSPEVVDMIYHMSREGDMSDGDVSEFVAAKLQAEIERDAYTAAGSWDQLVFLSANLTRLVIDPYREKCNSVVEIGPDRERPLALDWPIVLGGLDFARLPSEARDYFAAAAEQGKIALAIDAESAGKLGASGAQRIVSVDIESDVPSLDGAAAVLITAADADELSGEHLATTVAAIHAQTGGAIPLGVVAPACCAAKVVDAAVELDIDFFVADAQWQDRLRPVDVIPELAGPPAIHVLADVVERLRHHCKEEIRQVIYRGGIRDGADAGKAICCGATAVSLGLAPLVGMGHKLTAVADEESLLEKLVEPLDAADAARRVLNVAKSVAIEVTMLARACGKSSVSNMEPEDLRSMSIAASAATGIPLAGKDARFRDADNNGRAPS